MCNILNIHSECIVNRTIHILSKLYTYTYISYMYHTYLRACSDAPPRRAYSGTGPDCAPGV